VSGDAGAGEDKNGDYGEWIKLPPPSDLHAKSTPLFKT